MKALSFSIDIIVAIIFAVTALTLFPIKFEVPFTEVSYQKLSYEANDIVNLLSYLTARDMKNKTTISQLIENGVLKEKDLDKTLLDLIGSFWYAGNKSIAENISKEILENLTKEVCLNLTTGEETIYSSCNTSSNTVVTRNQIASGYEIGKPPSGYIARVWITKVKKNTTKIIPFYPEGSGWTAQRLEVTKKFSIRPDATILNATLYVSVHFGTDKSQAQFEQLKVNGNQRKNDVIWLYLEELKVGTETTTAAYGYVDVTNDLIAGNNTIELVIGTPQYHSHIHPGMKLSITYSLTEDLSKGNKTFRKRYYFDNVVGRSGSWSMVSFFVPENARNISAKLRVKANDVEDTKDIWGRNSSDVIIYINSDKIFFKDGYCGSSTTCEPLCPLSGLYYRNCNKVGKMNPVYEFNITSNITNGTNTVSVYLNCYGDIHWGGTGSDYAEIYSDPINDPENSSYVEIYYELEKEVFKYGEIDLTNETLFGGQAENPKTFSFNLTEGRKRVIESFTHIAQGFSSMIEVYAWPSGGTSTLVFTSPAIRVVPEAVYIPPSIWKVGQNFIQIRDFQPGGWTSPTNKILPWTSFEYTYLVKGLVGYGNVFNTSEEAIEDAKQRLIAQIGGEGISAENIQVDTKSVGGIEWLWGPSLFKIVMWPK